MSGPQPSRPWARADLVRIMELPQYARYADPVSAGFRACGIFTAGLRGSELMNDEPKPIDEISRPLEPQPRPEFAETEGAPGV
jgi:hypothetical protein